MVESVDLDERLATFWAKLGRTPVRWIVLIHAVALFAVITFKTLFPQWSVLQWLDVSLVIAQVSLLLIWLALDGRGNARRLLGVAIIVSFIAIAHVPVSEFPSAFLGLVCFVPALFLLVPILALPVLFAQSLGMQLQRFDARHMPPPRQMQFSVRGLLLVSIGVAVLFGLKEIPDIATQPDGQGSSVAAALAVAVMFVVVNGIYLSIPLVAVWVSLSPGGILPRMGTALIGWALGGMLIYHYMNIQSMTIDTQLPLSATAGGTAILLATLFVLRTMRYRVVWDSDLEKPVPESPFKAQSNLHDPSQ